MRVVRSHDLHLPAQSAPSDASFLLDRVLAPCYTPFITVARTLGRFCPSPLHDRLTSVTRLNDHPCPTLAHSSRIPASFDPSPPRFTWLQRRTEFVFPCRTVTKGRIGDVTPAVNHCFSLDIGPAFARS